MQNNNHHFFLQHIRIYRIDGGKKKRNDMAVHVQNNA